MHRKYNKTEKFLMTMRKNPNFKNVIPSIREYKNMTRSEKSAWGRKAHEWNYITKHYGNTGQGQARRGKILNGIFEMKENQRGFKGMWSRKMSEYAQGYQTQYHNREMKEYAKTITKRADLEEANKHYIKSVGKGVHTAKEAGEALLYRSLTEKGMHNKPVNLSTLSRKKISDMFYGQEKYPREVKYKDSIYGVGILFADGHVIKKEEYDQMTQTEQIQLSGGFNE